MVHCLSFDVEDWFHSHNLAPAIDRSTWDEKRLRVRASTRRILDLLDEHNTRATFFVLGHVADRTPELVKEIDERGHEVASHGYNHKLLYEQSPQEIRQDVERSLNILESLTTDPVRGYRAPSFSITEHTLEILDDVGLEYDSSNFPAVVHDRYGSIEVVDQTTFTRSKQGLSEAQLPSLDVFGTNIPWAGGGYFRFIPYPIYKRGLQRISKSHDFIFYMHPWEIDPEQPKLTDIPRSYRMRHYTNLDVAESRLERLLQDFDWQPIGEHV